MLVMKVQNFNKMAKCDQISFQQRQMIKKASSSAAAVAIWAIAYSRDIAPIKGSTVNKIKPNG